MAASSSTLVAFSPAPHDLETRTPTWRRITARPLLYECDEFLTPEECATLVEFASSMIGGVLGPPKEKIRLDLASVLLRQRTAENTDTKRASTALSDQQISDQHDTRDALELERRALAAIRRAEGLFSAISGRGDPSREALEIHCTPATSTTTSAAHLDLGLHLDTNNCRSGRWLTFIVYLTTVERGGHTVFPLARTVSGSSRRIRVSRGRDDSDGHGEQNIIAKENKPKRRAVDGADEVTLLQAADTLAEFTHLGNVLRNPLLSDHYRAAANVIDAHGELIARSAGNGTAEHQESLASTDHQPNIGMAIPPKQGRCVAFFTRRQAKPGHDGDDGGTTKIGDLDACSWHGGGVVHGSTPKWTLQKFKESGGQLLPEERGGGAGGGEATSLAECLSSVSFDEVDAPGNQL